MVACDSDFHILFSFLAFQIRDFFLSKSNSVLDLCIALETGILTYVLNESLAPYHFHSIYLSRLIDVMHTLPTSLLPLLNNVDLFKVHPSMLLNPHLANPIHKYIPQTPIPSLPTGPHYSSWMHIPRCPSSYSIAANEFIRSCVLIERVCDEVRRSVWNELSWERESDLDQRTRKEGRKWMLQLRNRRTCVHGR